MDTGKPACSMRRRVQRGGRCPRAFCPPLDRIGELLQMPVVALQAVEAQSRALADLLGQQHGGVSRRHATAPHADVHFDENPER